MQSLETLTIGCTADNEYRDDTVENMSQEINLTNENEEILRDYIEDFVVTIVYAVTAIGVYTYKKHSTLNVFKTTEALDPYGKLILFVVGVPGSEIFRRCYKNYFKPVLRRCYQYSKKGLKWL